MAGKVRIRIPNLGGTLTQACDASDTTLHSAEFGVMPTDLSSERVVALTLRHPAYGFETVWARGHAANGSPDVQVFRGMEGTTATPFPAGTSWMCAITPYDVLHTCTRATLPTDAFVGMRCFLTDEVLVVERTSSGKWAPSAGPALPQDVGPGVLPNGTLITPPSDAIIEPRMGNSGNGVFTDNNGEFRQYYRTPFPNNTLTVQLTNAATISQGVVYTVIERRPSYFRARVTTGGPSPAIKPNFGIAYDYHAWGF
jgi:hypothetical protein